MDWHKEGKAIYCYFDNDEKANAPIDAQRIRHMLINSCETKKA